MFIDMFQKIFDPNFRYKPNTLPLTRWEYVFGAVFIYLIILFFLQKWMTNRKRYDLNFVIPIHNFFLSALSLMMMCGILYGTLIVFRRKNFALTTIFCDPEGELATGSQVGWYYIFFLSKYYEFIDTIIICLKKKPVIFLHVYHHCITLILTFAMIITDVAAQWISMAANCMVHIPMYYYYGMSSLGYDIWWKKYITIIQIIQFILDLLSGIIGFIYFYNGYQCSGDIRVWIFGQCVIASFLILFIAFYKENYRAKKMD